MTNSTANFTVLSVFNTSSVGEILGWGGAGGWVGGWGFTVKLINLKLRGPSLERVPSKALGGALVLSSHGQIFFKYFEKITRHGTIRTVHTTYAAAVKTTTHPKTRCRKPYAATEHLMLLMMGVCTRNMSS